MADSVHSNALPIDQGLTVGDGVCVLLAVVDEEGVQVMDGVEVVVADAAHGQKRRCPDGYTGAWLHDTVDASQIPYRHVPPVVISGSAELRWAPPEDTASHSIPTADAINSISSLDGVTSNAPCTHAPWFTALHAAVHVTPGAPATQYPSDNDHGVEVGEWVAPEWEGVGDCVVVVVGEGDTMPTHGHSRRAVGGWGCAPHLGGKYGTYGPHQQLAPPPLLITSGQKLADDSLTVSFTVHVTPAASAIAATSSELGLVSNALCWQPPALEHAVVHEAPAGANNHVPALVTNHEEGVGEGVAARAVERVAASSTQEEREGAIRAGGGGVGAG